MVKFGGDGTIRMGSSGRNTGPRRENEVVNEDPGTLPSSDRGLSWPWRRCRCSRTCLLKLRTPTLNWRSLRGAPNPRPHTSAAGSRQPSLQGGRQACSWKFTLVCGTAECETVGGEIRKVNSDPVAAAGSLGSASSLHGEHPSAEGMDGPVQAPLFKKEAHRVPTLVWGWNGFQSVCGAGEKAPLPPRARNGAADRSIRSWHHKTSGNPQTALATVP